MWFHKDNCIFCDTYMPMRDTCSNIITKLHWHYLFSGAIDRVQYTKDYITYMTTWCNKWYIPVTTADKQTIASLLKETNWTREYWH